MRTKKLFSPTNNIQQAKRNKKLKKQFGLAVAGLAVVAALGTVAFIESRPIEPNDIQKAVISQLQERNNLAADFNKGGSQVATLGMRIESGRSFDVTDTCLSPGRLAPGQEVATKRQYLTGRVIAWSFPYHPDGETGKQCWHAEGEESFHHMVDVLAPYMDDFKSALGQGQAVKEENISPPIEIPVYVDMFVGPGTKADPKKFNLYFQTATGEQGVFCEGKSYTAIKFIKEDGEVYDTSSPDRAADLRWEYDHPETVAENAYIQTCTAIEKASAAHQARFDYLKQQGFLGGPALQRF